MYNITILFSGGIDSSVLLALFKDQGIECHPLFVDYGQITAVREYNAAKKISKNLGLKLEKVSIPDISSLTTNQLTNPSISQNPFYPNRNLLLLTIGSLHAFENKNQGVGIGVIKASGTTHFPDISQPFLDEFAKIVAISLNYQLAILTPFLDMTKREVVKFGRNLDVPFELTYSCLTNNKRPCEICESCISRMDALGE
jgi:7-cyano-7-deazaguanine synthase